MDNFIQEIDEELRREKQLALWRKYGRFVVAGALGLVIVVAAVVGWRQYQANRVTTAGLAYQDATVAAEAGRTEEALAAFARLAGSAPAGYAELARLQQAAALARQGDTASAAEIYDAMSRDRSVQEPFRQLALMLYGYAALDGTDPDALAARLDPLAGPAGPWRHSALELKALVERRRGNHAAAQEIFKGLADDPMTPPSIRARAAELLALGGS